MNRSRWLLGLLLVAVLGVAGWSWLSHARPIPPILASRNPPAPAVACLGRFEPEGGVLRIAAPYFQSRPSVIAALRVQEGDWVRAGQTIAILDGKPQVEA